ncbi:TfoX/Sxy family protein [Brevundimonas sp.]|jgi:DNA transformation protein and related proteins|uniref:TfoX/Sxy family protein n=1 Tax=Brevundimonas sp. TaxID=1871086 RepID=UPI00183F774F|nr:TfoX/Sxy family protein [Brevundimonas sp.]MBA4806291.1 TfoX/Sxy family protein [Brevundimonas sp.]
MAYDADFDEWVREHFHDLGRLEIKRMFGGAGVYASGVMFALLDDGVVWLKADEALAEAFAGVGSRQFQYPTKDGRMMSMGYWSLPETALDDPDEAVAWARRSVEVAVRKASGKKKK